MYFNEEKLIIIILLRVTANVSINKKTINHLTYKISLDKESFPINILNIIIIVVVNFFRRGGRGGGEGGKEKTIIIMEDMVKS